MQIHPSKYIDPDHLPTNFNMVDPRSMRQEQIILFFEHIAMRQQTFNLPDVFQFKTAKRGRKGSRTMDERDSELEHADPDSSADPDPGANPAELEVSNSNDNVPPPSRPKPRPRKKANGNPNRCADPNASADPNPSTNPPEFEVPNPNDNI
jgi:hypothetical protein